MKQDQEAGNRPSDEGLTKRAYVAPRLLRHGTLAELTAGRRGPSLDFNGTLSQKRA
jgi:hypothetical protein